MCEQPLTHTFKVFGANLDALDTTEAIAVKRAYLSALSRTGQRQIGLKDPYAYFQKILGEVIRESGHRLLGRFTIDTWLTPKPILSDEELINAETFDHFLCNNGFYVFAKMLKKFVEAHVFPDRPVMIGIDHSLTGGVLMALSERLRPENLALVVFDAHTDAVPLSIRRRLLEYASENNIPAPCEGIGLDSAEYYTAGNYLLYLLEKGIIQPNNVVIIGVADSAVNLKGERDKRIQDYVCHLDYLERQGVKIISKDELKFGGRAMIRSVLEKLKCSQLYISLDVDVAAQCDVLATRFIDQEGTSASIIIDTISELSSLISNGSFSLVGFDVMEIDIHKVGAVLPSGLRDRTGSFIKEVVSLLVSRGF